MNDRIFIDTNIWVYLYSDDKAKSNKSEELINEHFNRALLSTQVLNELVNVLAVKLRIKTKEETKQIIKDLINSFEIAVLTGDTIITAIDLSIKYNYRFFDSLMIATALQHNCKLFYSEDLQDSQIIEGTLTIVNPFK